MTKGYLTVYLSLSLVLILSFVLTLVEGARISTIRMETECVADIAMNSILAEFHRELLEQYDLLFVDMSYGTAAVSVGNTAEHLRHYMDKNFSIGEKNLFAARDFLALSTDRVTIPEYSLASDDEGDIMRRQALAYMKFSSAAGWLTKVTEDINIVKELGLDSRDIAGERNRIQSVIDAAPLPSEENEEGELIEMSLDNPADKINSLRKSGVLSLVLEDSSAVSGALIDTKQCLSNRRLHEGTGMYPGFSKPEGIEDKLLFNEYLFEKCGSYGTELDKACLKYQIEYILAGRKSDWENLEKIAEKLLLWREAANVIYILSDSAKCAQAQALALTLTVALQVPELVTPVKYSILFAWAFVESLGDVKALLKGGKVPVMKTSADWRTSIENIINFNGNTVADSGADRGLSYGDYLRIMLFLQENGIQNLRTMDVMEMDIRKTQGNLNFRMDACFDSFLADISVSSAFGYSYNVKKQYVYN